MAAPTNLPPIVSPTHHAYSPAFQVECLEYFARECKLISDLECLQRRHVLTFAHDANPQPTPGPGQPRDDKWRWRTLQQYRLSHSQTLEFTDEKKSKGWKEVISASRVFACITETHCQVLMHAGMDKTEGYITSHYKGIPRQAIRYVLAGCQACSVR